MSGWRRMKHAYRDGRPLVLRLRRSETWSAYGDVARWKGGVVATWSAAEDHWIVWCDPTSIGDGSMHQFDSYWFSGWKLLPDELYSGPAPRDDDDG